MSRVGIIGAGRVGSTLAQRLVEKSIADVVLLDVVPGLPQGLALDLMEARGVERHDCRILGTNDYADFTNCDVVVMTAGKPRLPGMSRDDLLQINAAIVSGAIASAVAQSPNAIFVIVTNPLDQMVHLAWKVSGLPPERVMGMAGVLDSARFQTFIALELGCSIQEVTAMVMGSHGDAMLPLPRYCTVNGIPIPDLMSAETIERLVQRTQTGGAEIVNLMKTGSAFYAPASSAALMVEAILRDQSRLVPAAAYLTGQYGVQDTFIGVPCRLGRRGVESILELPLTAAELATFQAAAQGIRDQVTAVLPAVLP